MIIIRQALTYLSDQADAALDAPVPIAIGIAIAAVLVWLVMRWRYGAVLERLRKSNERKDGTIRQMKGGGVTPPALVDEDDAAPEPAGSSAEEVRHRQKALRKIINAIDAADAARRSNDPDEIDKAMPAMGLGLLTARNAFDVQVPTPTGEAATDLDIGRQLLELVRPALLAGDDDEARRAAEHFLRQVAAEQAPAFSPAMREGRVA